MRWSFRDSIRQALLIPVGAGILGSFETVTVGDGRIVSVKPKAAVMPLVVVTMTGAEGKDWRSRPGSDPGHRTLVHGVLVGGLEELLELVAAGAA